MHTAPSPCRLPPSCLTGPSCLTDRCPLRARTAVAASEAGTGAIREADLRRRPAPPTFACVVSTCFHPAAAGFAATKAQRARHAAETSPDAPATTMALPTRSACALLLLAAALLAAGPAPSQVRLMPARHHAMAPGLPPPPFGNNPLPLSACLRVGARRLPGPVHPGQHAHPQQPRRRGQPLRHRGGWAGAGAARALLGALIVAGPTVGPLTFAHQPALT